MDRVLTTVVLSDSTGETALAYLRSVTTQFKDLKTNLVRVSNIKSIEEIEEIFETIPEYSLIIQTLARKEFCDFVEEKAKEKGIEVLPILEKGIEKIEKITGLKPLREVGLTRTLSQDYFEMIEAIEFAIQYDDGKDPRGFLKSDIVLLGVSRTSKTPTTMILATKKFKVSNLPLVPEAKLPQELFEIDTDRIIGLIIDPEKLSGIRSERSKDLGLFGESRYFDIQRIHNELKYANEVFKDLDCKVIDVTNNTIEQTTTEIVDYYNEKFPDEIICR